MIVNKRYISLFPEYARNPKINNIKIKNNKIIDNIFLKKTISKKKFNFFIKDIENHPSN